MAKKRPTRPNRTSSSGTVRRPAARRTSTTGPAAGREHIRRGREELQRQEEVRRRKRRLLLIGGLVVVVLSAYLFVTFKKTPSSTAAAVYADIGQNIDPATLPGIQTGASPWPPEEAQLQARLHAIRLDALTSGGVVLHTHQHVDVFVDGARVTVPANIGIAKNFLSAIHTHDDSGIVHVESPIRRRYTLGEFFDVWGVRFTSTCLGRYCVGGGKTLRIYVDGHLATGPIRQIELVSHEEIAVVYGASSDGPNPIPSSYGFPFGY